MIVSRHPRSLWTISMSLRILTAGKPSLTSWNTWKQLLTVDLFSKKSVDKFDFAKAFAALRSQLLGQFGSPNEVSNARRQFYRHSQLEGEAIDEYADALLKLNRAGWSGQTLEQRDTDLQNRFVERLRFFGVTGVLTFAVCWSSVRWDSQEDTILRGGQRHS